MITINGRSILVLKYQLNYYYHNYKLSGISVDYTDSHYFPSQFITRDRQNKTNTKEWINQGDTQGIVHYIVLYTRNSTGGTCQK